MKRLLRPIGSEKYVVANKLECTIFALEDWEEKLPCNKCANSKRDIVMKSRQLGFMVFTAIVKNYSCPCFYYTSWLNDHPLRPVKQ